MQCKTSLGSFEERDRLAGVYDNQRWLVKAMDVDREHQDVAVELLHPCGPAANVHPKRGRRDVLFGIHAEALVVFYGR